MEINGSRPGPMAGHPRVAATTPRSLYACLSQAARSTEDKRRRYTAAKCRPRPPPPLETWKRFDHGVKAEATHMGVAVPSARPQSGFIRMFIPIRPGVRQNARMEAAAEREPAPEGRRDVLRRRRAR